MTKPPLAESIFSNNHGSPMKDSSHFGGVFQNMIGLPRENTGGFS